ncbi:rod shape-determining protein MreD [bacterium]|nr:rod shape-determining protein MreD [bacterium]
MKTFLLILMVFIAVILQLFFSEVGNIMGVELDLILIFLLLLTPRVKPITLLLWAAAAGLVLDSFQPFTLGAFIFSKTTLAFIIVNVYNNLDTRKSFNIAVLALITGFIERLLYYFFNSSGASFLYSLWRYIIPGSIYTAVICLVIHFLWHQRNYLAFRQDNLLTD